MHNPFRKRVQKDPNTLKWNFGVPITHLDEHLGQDGEVDQFLVELMKVWERAGYLPSMCWDESEGGPKLSLKFARKKQVDKYFD